jgi:CBS domain-containing protein
VNLTGGTDMKVSEVMTRQVELASPDDTLEKAAGRMAELDTGVLPVGEGECRYNVRNGTAKFVERWPRR